MTASEPDTIERPTAPLRARPLAAEERAQYAAARLHAVHRLLPYLATAVFRLEPWAVDGLGTFGVDDRWRVYLDPAVVDEWGVPATAGVLLHEVGHALRDHAGQAELLGSDVDRYAWNLCGDAAINDDLVAAGVPLPGGHVLPHHLTDTTGRPMRTGRTAMEYYDALPRVDVLVAGGVGDRAPADRAPGTVPTVGTAATGGAVPDVDPGSDTTASPELVRAGRRPGAPGASCGRVAGGDPHPVDAPDGPGVTSAEQRLARRAVAEDVRRAAGTGRGTVPAGLARWAEAELAPPTVDWRQVLRGTLRRGLAHAAGNLDTTYARPSRRRVPGIVLPGSRRPVPSVAVVVDTSASMGDDALHAVLGEVEGIARQSGASGQRLRVLAVDAAVHEVRSVTRAAEVVLRGGGGTDLTPGLHAAVRGHPPSDVVVVCTDGFTPWPDEAPGRARWIVVLVRGAEQVAWGGEPPAPPAWAEVVEVAP